MAKKYPSFHAFGGIFFLAAAFVVSNGTAAVAVTARQAMAVTADPHATRAAYEVLQNGGNAVDAAIAAQWVLNVVEPQSSGLGGGGFFLYYEASSQRIYAFDGREKAPAEAYPEMFLDPQGKPCRLHPDCVTGGRPVGVPGTLKLLQQVYRGFGSRKFSFAELFDPAIELAEEGFPVSKRLAHFIAKERDRLQLFEASRKVFLNDRGLPLPPGFILRQPDLAATFRLIQKQGLLPFYEGEIAEDIVDTVRHSKIHAGAMKRDDLRYYEVKERQPVSGNYRGFVVFSMGPPSSGGTTILETLNILEPYPLASYGRKPDGIYLFTEAQRLAFQDRNQFIGDPDFVRIPVDQLISKNFARDRAQVLNLQEASNTTHISIVDEWGNMVAFTSTIEEIFGSAMMVPGRGFFLNNELTDFDLVPKDERGKLKPNAPEGDKRPRSSMSPVLVFKDGKPAMVAGSPGGSKIIGIVLNILVNFIEREMPLEQAVAAPRVINRDGAIEMEPALYQDEGLRHALEKRGQHVVKAEEFGNAQAISFDSNSGFMTGASDPRGEGEALGY